MKHLSRFLMASLFILSFSMSEAQNEDNPWALGAGVNAVDFYPVGEDAPQGDMFSEYFNAKDHWNILPSVSKLSVARYIGSDFSVKLAGSVNKIHHFGDKHVDDLTYYSLDAAVNYSFRNLINGSDGWFDPYLGVGAGYTWLGDIGHPTGNGTLGFNFWITNDIGLYVESTYKHSFSSDHPHYTHFQHSAGVKFVFGGKDTDGDGIFDKNDDCPETPGLAEFNGCPDSDGDGIPDKNDDCPSKKGPAEFNGCPDTDGDGIPDHLDECPTVAGLKSMNGCPDSDGDGIKDSEDNCPNEAGPKANNGCPYQDRDGDGVLDKDDQCPDVAGSKANNGCPEVTVKVINKLNQYSKTILFDLSKATIRKESYDALKSIGGIMKKYPETEFHLGGYTDSSGSAAYNEKLSKKRAASVRDYLVDKEGVDSNHITSEGYGEKNPIATNKTAAGRQKNRRVEVSLEKNRKKLESNMK